MAAATDLAKMVPGFEFLQGLLKNAGAALPNMGQWIAPTLDPEELAKRIGELRTVQFWLEQNARLLGTTIQALEVQRMTLATLQTMNLPLADLRESLKVPQPATPAAATAASAAGKPASPKAAGAAAGAAIDPTQWWGALTQQFGELAARAMKDSAGEAARSLAGAVVKQSIGSAGRALKKAVAAPAKAAAQTVAHTAAHTATRTAASRKRGA